MQSLPFIAYTDLVFDVSGLFSLGHDGFRARIEDNVGICKNQICGYSKVVIDMLYTEHVSSQNAINDPVQPAPLLLTCYFERLR